MNIVKKSWTLCSLFGIIAIVLFFCANIDTQYEDIIVWVGVTNLILAILSGIPWMMDEWASRRIKT